MHRVPRAKHTPLEQHTQKVLNYVLHTTFFQHMRNNYLSFRGLTKLELASLLKSAELLRVGEERSMVISFNQPTVCIIIYGEVIAEDKSYPIGKFFVVGQVKLSLSFKEKSLMVMLHQQSVQIEMQGFEDYYFKKKLIEKIIPVELLRLTKKQIKTLTDACDFRSSYSEEKIVKVDGSQFGMYLLLDGSFSIVSKEGVQLSEVTLDYFGEEILWGKNYDFCLSAESVQCRYIFLERDILLNVFNANNIKTFKLLYDKRLQTRKQLQQTLQDNIIYTRDFMNHLNLIKKATLINPQYKSPVTFLQKRINKQLKFTNVKISNQINSKNLISSRKDTRSINQQSERAKTHYDDTIISQQTNFHNFEPKLYRDQKAKSEHLFRRRVKSQVTQNTIKTQYIIKEGKHEKVTDRDVQSIKNLPKTLSVLLKYYESTEKLRPRPKSVSMHLQKGFVPCSRQRRIMTTMKLHKQIFMRQYFQIKALQDKAFKTWR